MPTGQYDARRLAERPLVHPWQPPGAAGQRRTVASRASGGRIGLIGFLALMAWALVGSLLLGLGRGTASPATAWIWLAGAVLIGVAVPAALLIAPPPGGNG